MRSGGAVGAAAVLSPKRTSGTVLELEKRSFGGGTGAKA